MKINAGIKQSLHIFLSGFLFIVCSIIPTTGSGQDPESEKKEMSPIPTAEIIGSIEEANSKIQEMTTLLIPQKNVLAIEEESAKYFIEIQDLQSNKDMSRLDKLSNSKLNDLIQRWRLHRVKLKSWQEILETRFKSLESERLDLLSSKMRWEITFKAAQVEKAPPQMLERQKQLLEKFNEIESKLKNQLDRNITLQSKVGNKLLEIEHLIRLIEENQQQKKTKIFSIDATPLWKVFPVDETEKDLSIVYIETIERHTVSITDFYYDFKDKIIIHLFIFLIILSILLILRNFGNKLILDKEAAQISKEILNHPYSVALLITLLITRWMYPHAPEIILKLAQLTGLVPILRLLPVLSVAKIRERLVIFIGLYLLTLIYVIAPEQTLIHRFYLLILSALSLVFFIMIFRERAIRSIDEKNRLVKYSSYLFRIGIPLMIIACITNIIGNVSLASLLTVGILSSIYLLIVLLAGGLVLISVFNLLMSTRIAFLSQTIRLHPEKIRKVFKRFIFLLALYFWLTGTLKYFNFYQLVYIWLGDLLSERLQVGSLDISLGDIIIFILAIYFSLLISRFIRFVLEEDILSRMKLPRGVPAAISMLSNYFIIGLGFLIAISAAGFDLSRLTIILGALGVGIGFGLQNIVNNFISGLILIFERPIQVGDVVELNNLLGTVKRIGIRSSTIRNYDGSEIIVPNANLISNEVTNWTLSDKLRRIQIKVGTTYSSNPEKVLSILREIIKNHPDILKSPEPMILFEEFGESSLNFDLRFWTNNPETWLQLRSDMSVRIYKAFKENGIEIPFPQRDLHLRSADPLIIDRISRTTQKK